MDTNFLTNMVITKVRSVSTLYTDKNTKQKKIDRPRWAVILKYEGETVYTSKGKSYLSDINHPIILPKGCTYEWECVNGGHFCAIDFECETQPTFAPVSFSVKNGEKLLKLFKEAEYRRNLRKPGWELECIRDLYSILLTLLRASEITYSPTDKQKIIAPALEYISGNYSENIRNETLAELVGVSTVYFRKLFTKITGKSPITYARAIRIEKAKEMLKSDYGKLSDIAHTLGYSSIYDFSRDFKKHVGIPPSEF